MQRSQRWSQIIATQEMGERNRLAEGWLGTIRKDEVNDLVQVSRTGTVNEKDAAMRVLIGLARTSDSRLSEAARKDWLAAANPLLRAEYPKGPAGLIAFQVLYENDLAALVQLITQELDLGTALAANHVMLVTHLGDLALRGAREAALDRLREIRTLGGAAGEAASAMLDRFDAEKRRAEFEELVRKWREDRTSSLLADLYHGPVGALLVRGVNRKDVIALLGPPDRKRKGMIWYVPSDATALSIEFDKSGKAIGWHMT